MKILITGDIHWSETSSIVRSIGKKYSIRLENLINSVNWVEELSEKESCDRIIYLGDFFDRSDINCTEITALMTEVFWNERIPHDFVVGNHEANTKSLEFNTVNILTRPYFNIISKPQITNIADFSLSYIPYLTEDDRKEFKTYIGDKSKKIVVSHNDLKGIAYGAYVSKEGFDLNEIEQNCNLFINGHLHNGQFINNDETILNLGNLTGQNFTEDANNYSHLIVILDTDTLNLTFYENPFAFNFYKIDIKDESDFTKLYSLKNNAVVTVKCKESLKPKIEQILKDVTASRIIIEREASASTTEDGLISINNIDHRKEFIAFIEQTLGKSELISYELSKVLGA